MTLVKLIFNYTKKNTGTALLMFIAISIPFKIIYGTIAIIIALFYSVYKIFLKKEVQFKRFNSFAFLFPLIFFLVTLASALLSKNYEEGISQIVKRLPAILLPLILFTLVDKKDTLDKLLSVFSMATIIATFILTSIFIFRFLSGALPKDLLFHNYTAFFKQHPVYFSLFIALSIFFITKTYLFEKEIKNKTKILPVLSITLLLVGMILASSKAVLAAFFLLYFIQWFIFFKTFKKKLLLVGLFLLGLFFIFNYTHIKKRFSNGLLLSKNTAFNPSPDFNNVKRFSSEEKRQVSDLELRIFFLKIGFYHTVYDHKYWFGYGLGDVQDNLDYYYMKYNLAPNWYEGDNLHNQYLQIFVTYGIFALLFLLLFLIYSFSIALKNKDILYILFLALLIFVFTFEVLLTRNKGIVFFYFFNTLFLINNIKFENSHIRN